MSWYLKKPDDSMFGPVDLPTLKSWAASGSVAPEDHISEDQENWIFAANLDDLQMDWVLEFEDGAEYGPLHVSTIKQMVEKGELDPGLMVSHRERDEKRFVWEIALVVLFKTNRHLKKSSAALADRLSQVEAAAADAKPTTVELPADAAQAMRDWKTASEKLDKQTKDTDRWKTRYEELREVTERELSELKEKIAVHKKQAIQDAAQNEKLDLKVAQADKRLTALQSSEGGGSGEVDAVMESYNELSTNYEVLLSQLGGKNEEIQSLMNSRAEAERHAEASVQEMSKRMHREQAEADSARNRFHELEETHLQLVKAYREMNDRYIQLRQNQGAPMSEPVPAAVTERSRPVVDTQPAKKAPGKSWKPKVRLNR